MYSLFISFVLNFLLNFHPFFVSLIEIKENSEKKQIEVSCRIFTDDLEKALKSAHLGIHDLAHPLQSKETEMVVAKYINQHVMIEVDGKKQVLNFIGFEIEEDACWSYFESSLPANPKRIHIHDEILYEAHPEQVNMIRFIGKTKNTSTKLENPKADFILDY